MKIAVLSVVAVLMLMGNEIESKYYSSVCNLRVRRGWLWGKREVRDADADAAYNAAAEDGVFTDDEIKTVFGVDVADFKKAFDMNKDGKVEVKEYETVNTVISNLKQDE